MIVTKTLGRLYILLTALFLAIAGCDSGSLFIQVAFIEGVPETGAVGTPLTLTATVRPAFANNQTIIWSVKNDGNTDATISGNILNAAAVGTVTIRATIANGIAEGKDYAQDFKINIIDGDTSGRDNFSVTGVTLDQTTLNLPIGGTATLTATVAPANAANKNVTWSSNETGVATVTNNGTLTAVSNGTATITVTTEDGEFTAICEVTVNKAAGAAVTAPTLNGAPTSSSITVNEATLLTATGQSIEYAISKFKDGTGLSSYQSSTTFNGLNVRTAYYVYARSKSNDNYNEGTASVSDDIITLLIEMVSISSGTFSMGSPNGETGRENDETQHQVTLSGFKMSKYQVTQEQYQVVMGSNPSYFTTAKGKAPAEGEIDGKRPVEYVTWYDAVEFCNKISVLEGLQEVYTISGRTPASGYPITNATVTADFNKNGYRLPTEAQWEYACRAGTTTAYNTVGGGASISDNTGWYTNNSEGKTHQVGLKPANAWGLYDMHGNVYEWCWDWFGNYSTNAQPDPTGVNNGTFRVIRGGSFAEQAKYLRSAYRSDLEPENYDQDLGIRLVLP